jgi:hypothetical protein
MVLRNRSSGGQPGWPLKKANLKSQISDLK